MNSGATNGHGSEEIFGAESWGEEVESLAHLSPKTQELELIVNWFG